MNSYEIGKKIKYYRQEKKLTQEELGDRIGVTWETVSKYERGVTEPYKRIHAIAKALNVDVVELLQNNYNSSTNNQIPLFTKIPKDFKFTPENTNFFYSCPVWILKKDRGVFAIDMDLFEKESKGIYYVSPNTKPKRNNLVLIYSKEELLIEKFQNQENILGVIMGKEVRVL